MYVAPSYSTGIQSSERHRTLTRRSWNDVNVRDRQATLYGGFDTAHYQKPKVSKFCSIKKFFHRDRPNEIGQHEVFCRLSTYQAQFVGTFCR